MSVTFVDNMPEKSVNFSGTLHTKYDSPEVALLSAQEKFTNDFIVERAKARNLKIKDSSPKFDIKSDFFIKLEVRENNTVFYRVFQYSL